MTAVSQASFSVKRPPKKPTNAERRSREYLTPHEVEHVIAAARKVGRHPRRDAVLILYPAGHHEPSHRRVRVTTEAVICSCVKGSC
jgi:hypothetical protein